MPLVVPVQGGEAYYNTNSPETPLALGRDAQHRHGGWDDSLVHRYHRPLDNGELGELSPVCTLGAFSQTAMQKKKNSASSFDLV